MPTYGGGRHEHGQNFLTDPRTAQHLLRQVSTTDGPIIEVGPGRGALTFGLAGLGRPLTAIEIDPTMARWLQARVDRGTRVVHDDFLRWRLPASPHVVVGNLPFHLTTAMLRKVLHAPGWTDAVLLVQWEVARRRAGIGGASMMTAQWWPWIDFSVHGRVPATAFRPAPTVDGGILVLRRRATPLVAKRDRAVYRAFVHAVFTGKGRGLAAVLARLLGSRSRTAVQRWLHREGLGPNALPKDPTAEQWAQLFRLAREAGWTASPRRPAGDR